MELWEKTLPFYVPTSSSLKENVPIRLKTSVNLLPLFKRPSTHHAECTAPPYWTLSVQNWQQVSYALSATYSLRVTLLDSRRCWAFSVEELLSWDSFCLATKAGGANVLDIYKGPLNRRPEEKPLIIHPPAHAGSASAARAASCAVPSMCRVETNILEKLQLTKGEKLMNSTLVFWFTVSRAGKDIKTLEPHPYCTSELTSGKNPSVVRSPLPGFSQLIRSITISLQANH